MSEAFEKLDTLLDNPNDWEVSVAGVAQSLAFLKHRRSGLLIKLRQQHGWCKTSYAVLVGDFDFFSGREHRALFKKAYKIYENAGGVQKARDLALTTLMNTV